MKTLFRKKTSDATHDNASVPSPPVPSTNTQARSAVPVPTPLYARFASTPQASKTILQDRPRPTVSAPMALGTARRATEQRQPQAEGRTRKKKEDVGSVIGGSIAVRIEDSVRSEHSPSSQLHVNELAQKSKHSLKYDGAADVEVTLDLVRGSALPGPTSDMPQARKSAPLPSSSTLQTFSRKWIPILVRVCTS